MSARTALWVTLTAFLSVFALTLFNGINNLGVSSYRFLSPNDVRGMAIEHQGLLYTLNFDQQNNLIEAFNLANPSQNPSQVLTKPPISKIIIYRFDVPDLQVELLGFSDEIGSSQRLSFTNRQWFPGVLSADVPSTFSAMLSNTYDPPQHSYD